MKKPEISVIVTSFNSGLTLDLCLQSLRNQDIGKNMEVIIVDDCSEDPRDPVISKKTVESDDRFKYTRHLSNKGTAQARRTGVRMSNGKFIGFLDADDYALPYCYSALAKELAETGADIAVADYSTFNEDADIFKLLQSLACAEYSTYRFSGIDFFQKQLERIPHPFYFRIDWWNKIYKRELFDDPRFQFPFVSRNEGTTSLCLSLLAKEVVVANIPLFLTRTAKGSLSRSAVSPKKIKDCILSSLHFRKFIFKASLSSVAYGPYLSIFMYIVYELNVKKIFESNLEDGEKYKIFKELLDQAFSYPDLRRDTLSYLDLPEKQHLKLSINFARNNPCLALELAKKASELDYYPRRKLLLRSSKHRRIKAAASTSVSIVTITKDLLSQGRENVFERMIESVKEQTIGLSRIEHIVIDAWSQDGTFEFLKKKYGDGLFDIVLSEPDSGVYNAMNKGLSLCTANYFLFLNSDDYLSCEALEKMVKVCERNGVDYVYADALKVDDKERRVGSHIGDERKAWFGSPYCHQALLCKSSTCRGLKFDESYKITMMKYAHDLYMSSRTGIHIPEKLACFRIGGLSTHESQAKKMQAEQLSIKAQLAASIKIDTSEYLFFEAAFRNEDASAKRKALAALDVLQAEHSPRLLSSLAVFLKDVRSLIEESL